MKRTTCAGQTSLVLECRRPTIPELFEEPKRRAEIVVLMGDIIVEVFNGQTEQTRSETGAADEHRSTA